MTFSTYGLRAYDVLYLDGSTWMPVTNGSISVNTNVWKKITFPAINTTKIRIKANEAIDNGYTRITEVEAWSSAAGGGGSANINWLVSDQLGTPRMIFDRTGSLANVKRHDYLPFGEELVAGQGLRTSGASGLGYDADNVRQKFTSKERDNETGLDYSINRYYSSTQGRFTSTDPTLLSVQGVNPQTWNRYTYVSNNPLRFIDPLGLWELDPQIERDKKGHIKHVTLMVKKSKEGDNAASLVKQLGSIRAAKPDKNW